MKQVNNALLITIHNVYGAYDNKTHAFVVYVSGQQECSGILDETVAPAVCYTYHSIAATFDDAMLACQSVAGRSLATIANQHQNDLVREVIERDVDTGAAPLTVWIGGNVRHNDVVDSWRWLDGKSIY